MNTDLLKYAGKIDLAVEEAKKSTFVRSNDRSFRVGAIIFKGKRILSRGFNFAHRSAKKLHPQFHLPWLIWTNA